MRRIGRPTFLSAPVAIAAGLAFAACGGTTAQVEVNTGQTGSTTTAATASAEPTTTTGPTTSAPATGVSSTEPAEPPATQSENNFPDATVLAVDTGEPFNLRMLGDSGTPVAMWFYYPH